MELTNTELKDKSGTPEVARSCLSSALKLGIEICYANGSPASPYLF